jgi:hypothetical protein
MATLKSLGATSRLDLASRLQWPCNPGDNLVLFASGVVLAVLQIRLASTHFCWCAVGSGCSCWQGGNVEAI